MHLRDHGGALADGRRDPLGRSCAHVADGENARDARFQRSAPGRTGSGAGQDEAARI